MNYLITDEQTIADLSVFDKPGKVSIFDLFNKTQTTGGTTLLAELFRQPLTDEKEINRRSALYSFFSKDNYVYPVDAIDVGMLAYYMENNDVRSQLQTDRENISQRLKNMVAADASRLFVENGVQSCLRIFYQLAGFGEQMGDKITQSPYLQQYNQLVQLVNNPAFSHIKQLAGRGHETKLSSSLLAELDKTVRFTHRELTLQLLDLLYDLDVNIAIGQVARNRGFTFAQALPQSENSLRFRQVYHPNVEKAIANNLELETTHNVLFLTGANMAGKSTLMKAIGVALYLAHMGFPVAAESMEFAVRDGIYTNINLADNLNAGASHFYAEVLRVKEVAQLLSKGKRLFVIFDELFRGTNVKDAYDGTIALTRAFSRKNDSQFIISTHIMEAGELLSQEGLSIRYRFLPTRMEGNTPVYTRILKKGITDDRQGMIIIENEGILKMLDAGLQKQEVLCNS